MLVLKSVNGGWRTALPVPSGEANIYLRQTYLPGATGGTCNYGSALTGSIGWVLRRDQFSAAQEWFILGRAAGTTLWSLLR